MTEVTLSTQQLLAIVSASGIGRSDVSINFPDFEPGSAEAYEATIAMIESAGGTVERKRQEFNFGCYELAVVNPDPDEFLHRFRLIGPIGHTGIDPDERVNVTPEGKLALRVIPGGVA